MSKKFLIYISAAIVTISFGGCKKFLDIKTEQQLVIISNLQDLQALMDNYGTINYSGSAASEFSSDNYYITYNDWLGISENSRRMYIWEKDDLFDRLPHDWSKPYQIIYISNTVLEGLSKIEKTAANQQTWDHVKGQALFLRSNAYLQVLSIWGLAYDASTASSQLGIPLRKTTDFNQVSTRSTLEESYQQVLNDLKESIPLLPELPVHPFRASRAATYGLLARTYLWMRDYPKAGKFADSSLAIKSDLLDYNGLNPAASLPVPFMNKEVIFMNNAGTGPLLVDPKGKIDSVLYSSYSTNDLRKTIFFKSNNDGSYVFKGTYTGDFTQFAGIAVDEVYLMSAEAQARAGNIPKAMTLLNSLLEKRWKAGSFIPYTASTTQEAVNIILVERRKELLMRCLRWMDLKRLNMEGANFELKRILNNQVFILPPNDLRYALPIPREVIELSGMQQNPR